MERRATTLIQWTAVIMLLPLMSACVGMKIRHTDRFPADRFAAVWNHVQALEAKRRAGDAHATRVCLLVYDGDDGDLVDMHAPIWLAAGLTNGAMDDDGASGEAAGDWTDVPEPFRHLSSKDLKALGPGLLVQVEDVEEATHVLIWLE